MDYDEEQRQEFEILSSIYTEDELIRTSPTSLKILLRLDQIREDDPPTLVLSLTFPSTYPDVTPQITILNNDTESFSQNDVESLQAILKQTAEESMGMVMAYTLASQLVEDATTLIQRRRDDEKSAEQAKEQAKIQRENEELELELRRREGKLVTYERFIEWKNIFDIEMARRRNQGLLEDLGGRAAKKAARAHLEVSSGERKLTGREAFEKGLVSREEDDEDDGEEDDTIEHVSNGIEKL